MPSDAPAMTPRSLNRLIQRPARLNKLTKVAADQHLAPAQRSRHGHPLTVRMERLSLIAETYRGSAQHQTIY
jgi:hypothetical protein